MTLHEICSLKRMAGKIFAFVLGVFLVQGSIAASAYEALEWGQASTFTNFSKVHATPQATKHRHFKRKKLNTASIRRGSYKSGTYSKKNIRIASLNKSFGYGGHAKFKRERSKRRSRGIIWAANPRCLNKKLKSSIEHVANNWGLVRVNSTCRSRKHNRRVGGSKHSYHLTGNAADIRIWGNVRAAARYLRKVSGGYKHYGGGLFHIDTGPQRSW